MLALTLINQPLAWGLAGILVPVLIHLFLQRQKRVIQFSTLFFLKATRRRPEKKRIDNWLLLAMRMLLVAMLAMAFTRPFFRTNSAAGNQPRVAILLLDRSLSLQAVQNGQSRWESLQRLALDELEKLNDSTPVALISAASLTAVILPYGSKAAARTALSALKPSFEETDLNAGLQEALRVAARRPKGSVATLFIVSDLQRASAENVRLVGVPEDLQVEVLGSGAPFLGQAAVREAHLTANGKVEVVGTNYSDIALSRARFSFSIDGKPQETKALDLPAFGSASLEFNPPELAAGFHRLHFELEPDDALAADNRRDLAVLVPAPVPVLLVETRPGEPISRQQGYFLATALDPQAPGASLSALPYAVERVSPDALAGRLTVGTGKTAPRLVVLPSFQPLTDEAARALTHYVEQGGGLLVFLGTSVIAREYNNGLQTVLPALIGASQEPAERPGHTWSITSADRQEMFTAFKSARTGDLTLPRFEKRFGLTALSESQVRASFDDGVPAILTRQAGAGRVALVNTTLDTEWTDWPKRRTFVPVMRALAGYLVDEPTLRSRRAAVTLPTAINASLSLGSWAANQTFTLQHPDGSDQSLQADSLGTLSELDLRQPGFYTLEDSTKSAVRLIVAVSPVAEQDLTSFPAGDFTTNQIHRLPAATRPLLDLSNARSELWKLLLLTGALLALGELFVANRSQS